MTATPTINEMAINVQEYMVEKYGNSVHIGVAKKHIKAAMKQGRKMKWNTEQVYGAVIRACRDSLAA